MSELIVEPNVRIFAICAGILVIKMILTGTATGLLRMLRGAYATPEDYALLGKPPGPPDPQVERLRRAHLNDLENILPFLGIGFLFAQSGASYTVAWWLFVVFDIEKRRLDVELSDSEIRARLKSWKAPVPRYTRGVLAKYARSVSSAADGAVSS